MLKQNRQLSDAVNSLLRQVGAQQRYISQLADSVTALVQSKSTAIQPQLPMPPRPPVPIAPRRPVNQRPATSPSLSPLDARPTAAAPVQSRPYPPSLLDLPLVQLHPRCRQPPDQPSVTAAPPQSTRQRPAPRARAAQPYQPRSAIAARQHPFCTSGSPQAAPAQHNLGSSTATQTPE